MQKKMGKTNVGFLNVDDADLIMILSEFNKEELNVIEKYNKKLKKLAEGE